MEYEITVDKNVSSSKDKPTFDVTLVAWDRFGGGMRHGRGFGITKTEAQTVVKRQARLYNAYVTYKTPEVEKFYQGGD